MLGSDGFLGEAEAGSLKSVQERAIASKYFDWSYAQKVWFEMNTWDLEEKEWAKCAADFEPWLAKYKQSPRAAFAELDKMPKPKKKKVQQCYDIQLAYDQWFDHVYLPWYNGYPSDALYAVSYNNKEKGVKAPTFDDYLASYGKRASCSPDAMLDECGPVPDWRSPTWRAKEQEMMAKAQQYADEQYAKRMERSNKAK